MLNERLTKLTLGLVVVMLLLPALSYASGGNEHGFLWISLLPFYGALKSFENPQPQLMDLSFGGKAPLFITADPLIHGTFIILVLLLATYLLQQSIRKMRDKLVPDARLSLYTIFELICSFVLSIIDENIGPKGRKFLPLLATIFTFILFSNLLGLIPGFLPPTSNLNTNLACALVIFVSYHYYGIKEHGIHYIKQFTGPLWALAPLMIIIEIISHLARPLSLSVRLFGNIFGDHLALAIFSGLVPLIVPIPFLVLGIFVSVLQAFIFTMLSMLYLGGAISHDH